MARTISIADTTKTKVTRKPPLLIMIAGATGVGKSTTAVSIASEHSIVRFVSTDAIRETMRVADSGENHALHRSSFSRGESGDPVLDWQDTCKAVESGVLAAIERAQREAAAKESAPWQDESWSEDGEESEDSEDIGGDVEWD